MAKKAEIPSLGLFAGSVLLLSGGWLMASFPILIFFGIAPLFALADRVTPSSPAWEKMEWILLAMTISFFASTAFHPGSLVASMVYGILLTLSFLAHAWVVRVHGPRAGKITIVLFWLAIEYGLLKVRPDTSIYLADALRLQMTWTGWNSYTGYLGASCWILVVNAMWYQTFLAKSDFQWTWLVAAVTLLVGPIIYSHFLDAVAVSRLDMVSLYADKTIFEDVTYLAQGEWVVRTATWLSILILLYTTVRSKTKKR